MELDDNFRKEWIDFMSSKVGGIYKVPLYIPDVLKPQIHHLQKCPARLKVNVEVVEKYTSSVKVKYDLFGNTFEEIIYLPTSKSIQQIINDTNRKIENKVNDWLKENNNTFVENEYKRYNKSFKDSIEKFQFERLQQERKQKLNRITNG